MPSWSMLGRSKLHPWTVGSGYSVWQHEAQRVSVHHGSVRWERQDVSCSFSKLHPVAACASERMFVVFHCGAECENTWASVVERLHRAYFLAQPEERADSALLAKRRLHGGFPPECNSSRVTVSSQQLENARTACKASNGLYAGDLDSFRRSFAGHRVSSWNSALVHEEQHVQIVKWPNRITIPASTPRPGQHWQQLEESDADVAVDVDCCGDSGSVSKLSLRSPGVAACAITKSLHRLSSRHACRPLPTLPEQDKPLSRPMATSGGPARQQVLNTLAQVVLGSNAAVWTSQSCLLSSHLLTTLDALAGADQQPASGYHTQNAKGWQ